MSNSMTISERAAKHAARARRTRRLIIPLVALMWLIAAGLWMFKLSVLLRVGHQHGIHSYSGLLSTVFSFGEHRQQFSRWDVFLLIQGNSMRIWAYVLGVVTIFLVANIRVLRFIETFGQEVAARLEHGKADEIARAERKDGLV